MSIVEDYFGPPKLETLRPLTRSFALGREWEVAEFLDLLSYAQSMEASDIHLKSGSPPRIRTVKGVLTVDKPEFREPIGAASLHHFILYLQRLTSAHEPNPLENDVDLVDSQGYHDFSVKIANSSMRVSAYRETSGRAVAIRFFYNRHISLEYIAIPELAPLLEKRRGLFIATGPTGAGKTTTLAAMVNHLNEREPMHIATLEDPVEYIHTDKRARITQRNVPIHVPSYQEGLVSLMRQDPDVILIGELRTPEIMKTSLLAAESGHLVFTTMHASSVSHAIHRYTSFFPSHEQHVIRHILADTLIGICNQRLLPTPHGKWALAFELMAMSSAASNLIHDEKYAEIEVLQQHTPGMIAWDHRMDALLTTGMITEETWQKNRRDLQRPNPLR